jgi:Txe/YoeB family toxin of toxin-antitoxin system
LIKLAKVQQNSCLRKKGISCLAYERRKCKVHPTSGTGKPEALRGDRKGQWSRRITKEHRLIYEIHEDIITVVSFMQNNISKRLICVKASILTISCILVYSLIYSFIFALLTYNI